MDKTLTQRISSAIVAGATILWAVGIGAFAVPQVTHAASAGDLIKGSSLSTLYYYGYDGSRYTFPNLKTYETWYLNFSGVQTLSDSALAAIPLAGNVVYRPGSYWVKIQSDPKTYAVSTDGTIRWIETETVATNFAGSNWNTQIHDVPDTFFVDYTVGTSLMDADAFDGMMWKDGSNYYADVDGAKRLVSSAGRTANNMRDVYFLDGTGIDASALSSGAEITAEICNITDAAQTGCVETAGGDLSVALASSTAAGATLPQTATSVPVFSFNVTAGSEAATLNQLVLTLAGVGATTNIDNVYLYEGAERLTESRSINASTRQATFGSLNYLVAANTTKTLTVRADINSSAAAGSVFNMQIKAATDVTVVGGTAGGVYPINGNSFTFAGVDVGTLTVAKNGTISNPSLGANDSVIAQFSLAAATEDASVRDITLKIDNAADHSDFKLMQGTTLIATGTYIGDKLVLFSLATPYSILEGTTKIFKVTADIGGESAETILVSIDKTADVYATGSDYGYGMYISNPTYDETGAACSSTSEDCSYSTIQGGDVTFSLSGPATGDILTNSQDQVLLEYTITAKQAITVKDMDIIVYGEDNGDDDAMDGTDDSGVDADGLIRSAGSEGNIKDIKIVNKATGTVVMGPLELDLITAGGEGDGASDGAQTIDFTDDFEMAAGETLTLQVKVDVDNNLTSGTELGATFDKSGFVAEDTNGDTVTNIVPSTDLVGYNQTAGAASLTLSLASTPGDVTTIQGADGVLVQKFQLTAGSVGTSTVTEIVLAAFGDADDTTPVLGGEADGQVEDFVESCSIYDSADALIGGPESPSTDGTTITFDNLSWDIAASENEVIAVKCNMANPSETSVTYLAFDITTAASDIVAQDAEGNDLDPTGDTPNSGVTATNLVTVNASGTLAFAKDSSSPSADILLTGSTKNLVATYRMTASSEDFNVQTLGFEEGAAIAAGQTAGTYANNVGLVTLEYKNAAGTTKTATTTMSGDNANFTGLDAYVDTDSASLVKVYVDVPVTDRSVGGSATSNEKVQMTWNVDSSGTDQYKAVGVASGATLTEANEADDLTAATFIVKETKPTISVSSSTPSGTGFVPGNQEAFRFNVAANSNEDVIIDQMVFKMNSTDNAPGSWNECDAITASDFTLYDLTDSNKVLDVDADWSCHIATGVDNAFVTNADIGYISIGLGGDITTPIIVPAGTTHTFALYFDSTGASSSADDSVQFSIPADPFVTPIVASNEVNLATFAKTDTTLDIVLYSNFNAGDVVSIDIDDGGYSTTEELVLVTASTNAGTDYLTVVRGYGGTALGVADDHDVGDDLYRIPSSFYWQDDGDDTSDGTGQYWGSYLVDNLPISGGVMGF
ncbi:MAG: hypothetical protein WCT24_01535 [Patescibacteria group bacterium]